MSDNQRGAIRPGASGDSTYRGDNPGLLVDCPGPTADAFRWFGEETVGGALEFLAGKVAGAGAVVLAEIRVASVD